MSERPRRRRLAPGTLLGQLILAGYLAVAPSSVAEWELDPRPRPGITLLVGDPVPPIDAAASWVVRRGR